MFQSEVKLPNQVKVFQNNDKQLKTLFQKDILNDFLYF